MLGLEKSKWIVEQVLWAEQNLKNKNGAEKKAEVIKKLDEMIVLPAYLEWLDDIIISYLVDLACDKLNAFKGHDFGKTDLSIEQENEIAEVLNEEAEKQHGK